MTQATGSQSQAQSNPWEQSWNDVKVEAPKPVEEKSSTAPAELPWEQTWSNPTPPATPKQIPPSKSTKPGNWEEINRQYAQGKEGREKEKLRILNEELANQTDPKNRAALLREIARMKN